MVRHRDGRLGPNALPVRRAIAEQHVILGVFVDRIDAGQAGEAEQLRFAVPADRAPYVCAPTREVRLEPALVDFDTDMTMRSADAGGQRAVLSPPVDDGHVSAFELSKAYHAAISRTASVTRVMSSRP